MPYAIVTGASKGIGKALAESLAKRKFDLLLVARSKDLLQQLCNDLSSKFGVTANYLTLDLSQQDATLKILNWVEENNFEVQVLVNNAGYGLWGNFVDQKLQEQNEMLTVNISTMVNLCYLLLPKLQKHKQAYILNVCSTSAYQAVPTLTLYAAAKAFVLSFTRGLRQELKHTGVSVTCLSPGATKTNFVARAGMHHMQEISDRMSMTPEQVGESGIRAMLKKQSEIIPGFSNKLGAALVRIAPKSLVENIAGVLYKKKKSK